jgi:hypothetical protein
MRVKKAFFQIVHIFNVCLFYFHKVDENFEKCLKNIVTFCGGVTLKVYLPLVVTHIII